MKKLLSIILSAIMLLSLTSCTKANKVNAEWQEKYDAGLRYLNNLEYESAIQSFNEAIQIDPKQAPAYVGLADVYIAQGDISQANDVLTQAEEAVSDKEALKEITDQLPEDIYHSEEDVTINNPDGSPKYEINYENGTISDIVFYGELIYTQTFYDEAGRISRVKTFYYGEDSRIYKEVDAKEAFYNHQGYYFEKMTFINEYIYTDGSPDVIVKSTMQTADRSGSAETTYTMQSRKNSVSVMGQNWDGGNPIHLVITYVDEYNENTVKIRQGQYNDYGKLYAIAEFDEYGEMTDYIWIE